VIAGLLARKDRLQSAMGMKKGGNISSGTPDPRHNLSNHEVYDFPVCCVALSNLRNCGEEVDF
jgi:hypothetical protein